ncbi:methyltransferase domain-containing protein [Aequorivita xiaoshiensis]|uniref:Methyltransferase domain-containing protein n=1 Tax=Aequorivita xiaoshiensis TaxID=2874476 RepID=A0A9X1R1X2_9FLAO|nr:methyltransferase domain-containing protein [Aequorivita xiaoshiensis]MCG2430337.1 methyltransferase domain-containing protein [Aequorivita xiaoshiensis]
MINFSNKHRSSQVEVMDSLDFQGEELKNLLNDLKTINKWLGGNHITIDGVKKLIKNHSKGTTVTILDIGCGDGEMLRRCADYSAKQNLSFKLIGIDFNENILEIAKSKSAAYSNISFLNMDVVNNTEAIPETDIVLCTLFLHHFNNEEIKKLTKKILIKSRLGIVINDLERSKLAFNLFKLVHKLFLKTKTARHDGLISIAKGFKKNELVKFSEHIPNQRSTIRWCWAYRFQWIIKKNR